MSYLSDILFIRETDVTTQTLEAAAELLTIRRNIIRVIDAAVKKESQTPEEAL
ncbi:MAG TPA: hypothetical protein VF026_14125 [Ktedonobacteraceae bacterium]